VDALIGSAFFLIGIPAWLICGFICGMIGMSTGHGCLCFICGVLFGPFALVGLFFDQPGKRCDYCMKYMHEDAVVCPYCRSSQIEKAAQPKAKAAPVKVEPKIDVAICRACGGTVLKGAKFCVHCGIEQFT
jgi:RNA polymerase subunit RPABC4/transcription elongation factor Spt4